MLSTLARRACGPLRAASGAVCNVARAAAIKRGLASSSSSSAARVRDGAARAVPLLTMGAAAAAAAYVLARRDRGDAAGNSGAARLVVGAQSNAGAAGDDRTARLETLFYKYATVHVNGHWYLSRDDFLKAVMSADKSVSVKTSSANLDALFAIADTNGDNLVSLTDFIMFYVFLKAPESEFEIAFRMIDSKGSGKVSKADFLRFIRMEAGEHGYEYDVDDDLFANFFGPDGKRELSLDEFRGFMRKFHQSLLEIDFSVNAKGGAEYVRGEDFVSRVLLQVSGAEKIPAFASSNAAAMGPNLREAKLALRDYEAFHRMLDLLPALEKALRMAAANAGGSGDTFSNALRAAGAGDVSPDLVSILVHVFDKSGSGEKLDVGAFLKMMKSRREVRMATFTKAEEAAAPPPPSRTLGQKAVYALQSFVMGGVAGAIGAVAVYPIDLVKTRMQNQRSGNVVPGTIHYKSSIDCFRTTFRNEGFVGLYKGLGPQLVGVAPEKAIKLVVNDVLRSAFKDDSREGLYLPLEILAGGGAGASQVVFTNPLEIVKIRLQVQGQLPADQRKGAVRIVRELGFVGLYKGASACFLRDIPFSAIYFPLYAKFKEMRARSRGHLEPVDLLIAGSGAGVFAASLTTPADVIKTRLQVEARKGESTYSGLLDCGIKVTKQEGFQALWKGVTPRIVRSSPQFGVTLLAYETMQRFIDPQKKGPVALPLEEDDLRLLELTRHKLTKINRMAGLGTRSPAHLPEQQAPK